MIPNRLRHAAGRQLASLLVLLLVASGATAGSLAAVRPATAAVKRDLKAYYPNPARMQRYYLEGTNFPAGKAPSRSVLWFKRLDQWSFRQYNWAPPITCHWDQLSWWDDGFLRYVETRDACTPGDKRSTVYDPPIIYLPRYWTDGEAWSLSGTSEKTDRRNGVAVCKGTTSYTATIVGWEEVQPGVKAIHWKTRQTTEWAAFGECRGWEPTEWEEHQWLVPKLPVKGGRTDEGVIRAAGGNLANPPWDWDIWFTNWQPLPRKETR